MRVLFTKNCSWKAIRSKPFASCGKHALWCPANIIHQFMDTDCSHVKISYFKRGFLSMNPYVCKLYEHIVHDSSGAQYVLYFYKAPLVRPSLCLRCSRKTFVHNYKMKDWMKTSVSAVNNSVLVLSTQSHLLSWGRLFATQNTYLQQTQRLWCEKVFVHVNSEII